MSGVYITAGSSMNGGFVLGVFSLALVVLSVSGVFDIAGSSVCCEFTSAVSSEPGGVVSVSPRSLVVVFQQVLLSPVYWL